MTVMPMLSSDPSSTVTTWDGSTIPGMISGLTAHVWVADATGTYHTNSNLGAEWHSDYAAMLAGHGDTLTAMQRMEGNAEAVIENTGAAHLSTGQQAHLREDLQREYDAIGAAMQLNSQQFGIDPGREFNSYTYLKMEQTLQGNEQLLELGYQGHGVNDPASAKYDGFTTDFQHKVDAKTLYVGGGIGTGEKAIADFLDDDVLTHAPFPSVMQGGVEKQLDQNGDPAGTVADAVAAINATAYARVFVASDFSTNAAAIGAVVMVPNVMAAPALPVAAAGQVTTLDGSIIAGTITGTPHSWVADGTGLFHTGNLASEWKADLALLKSGATLTSVQRWEANAELVIENTNAAKLSATSQQALREDVQREIDAVWTAMEINQTNLGIADTARFTTTTYLAMEHTLRGNESLETLAIEGHGLNGTVPTQYTGFTENFQHKLDGKTLYVGGGLDNGEKAIADYFDDVIFTHAPFPTVMHNGVLFQLNQNGNREDTLDQVVPVANNVMFTLALTASDFTRHST